MSDKYKTLWVVLWFIVIALIILIIVAIHIDNKINYDDKEHIPIFELFVCEDLGDKKYIREYRLSKDNKDWTNWIVWENDEILKSTEAIWIQWRLTEKKVTD